MAADYNVEFFDKNKNNRNIKTILWEIVTLFNYTKVETNKKLCVGEEIFYHLTDSSFFPFNVRNKNYLRKMIDI